MLTYNTAKGFKMKQGMRYAGYSEAESKDCTLQKRVQQANMKKLLVTCNLGVKVGGFSSLSQKKLKEIPPKKNYYNKLECSGFEKKGKMIKNDI